MPDWSLAVAYVAVTWLYQAISSHRLHARKEALPIIVLPVVALAAGVAIGDWWAPALALSGLPAAVALNRRRGRSLRGRDAVVGTAIDASFVGLGCVVVRSL